MKIRVLGILLSFFILHHAFGQNKDPAPFFTSKPKSRVSIDSVYSYRFSASDSLAREVRFPVQNIPGWLTWSSSENKISGKPSKPGQYPVHIQATNGTSTADQHFMITVFNKRTINILTLGNSITNGTEVYNSYRRALWKKLHEANYNFDMIGSWDKHHWGGEVPDPDFDMDHEGHSGWTAGHMFTPPDWDIKSHGNIKEWLKEYSPDIVLVELGTNDVFQCRTADEVIKDFSELVSVLRAKNSRVKIFIASVLPLGQKWSVQNLCNSAPYGELINTLNKKIAVFVPGVTTKQSPVVLVDQFTGIDPVHHMYDDIHPNAEGERIVAERWFKAIRSNLAKIGN